MGHLTIGDLNPTTQTLFGGLNTLGDGQGAPVAPSVPSIVTSSGDGSITVSWSVASDGGSPVLGWQARVYDAADSSPPAYTQYPATSFGTTFSGLTNGTSYTVQVSAFNSVGSSPVGTTTATPTLSQVPPGPPRNLVLTPLNTAAGISFAGAANEGSALVTHYNVTVTGEGVALTYTLDSEGYSALLTLPNDVPLTVAVSGVSVDGVSPPTTGFVTPTEQPSATGLPGPVRLLSSVPGNGGAEISWSPPSYTGLTGVVDYLVEASADTLSFPIRYYSTDGLTITLGNLVNDAFWLVSVSARSLEGVGESLSVDVIPSRIAPALVDPVDPSPTIPYVLYSDGVYPNGYVALPPIFPTDPPVSLPVPVPQPNIIAFYPIDDDRGVLEGAFSPVNWAGVE